MAPFLGTYGYQKCPNRVWQQLNLHPMGCFDLSLVDVLTSWLHNYQSWQLCSHPFIIYNSQNKHNRISYLHAKVDSDCSIPWSQISLRKTSEVEKMWSFAQLFVLGSVWCPENLTFHILTAKWHYEVHCIQNVTGQIKDKSHKYMVSTWQTDHLGLAPRL